MKKELLYRWGFYLLGLLFLAFGITLNTKTGLGVSPIISVSYSVSEIWNMNFGNMTMVLYTLFVVVEMILHLIQKKGKLVLISDMLQIPLSLVFTRFMNLFAAHIPVLKDGFKDQFPGSYEGRILFLLIAIVFTGVGAAMSLNMHIIPNPGDGIVQTIAEFIGKSVGLTKNIFDISLIVLTIILSYIFSGKIIGIGIGTILAMVGVGRVIALFNYLLADKMEWIMEA